MEIAADVASGAVGDPDVELLDALRVGDDAAFATLVGRYHMRMLRLAESFVPTRAVAEEVVQDTWLGVVKGIHRFEGRSSVKTWLFRILVNRAKATGMREPRNAALDDGDGLDGRFDAGGHWAEPPEPWTSIDSRLDASEIARRVKECLPKLPAAQRQVLILRDIEGADSAEVCDLLKISATNQRVLLHRARSHVRVMLELELGRG
jgi:RNA polymerase sigma-70 factor (ECF subfamily)